MQRTLHVRGRLGDPYSGEIYTADLEEGGARREVLLRMLPDSWALDPPTAQRLREEGEQLAAVGHPGLPPLIALGRAGGRWALVLPPAAGQPLADVLAQHPILPLKVAVELVGALAGAAAAAWDGAGGPPPRLLHRDIQPATVFLGQDGQPRLLDFGLAQAEVEREVQTHVGVVVGGTGGVAPERLAGRPATLASEVYSLGALLALAWTGAPPGGELGVREMAAAATDPAFHAGLIGERLAGLRPPEVRALVVRTLDFDPTKRPSAAEVADRCAALAAGLPGPGLRQWAAERRWPAPEAGFWTNQALPLEEPASLPAEPEPAPIRLIPLPEAPPPAAPGQSAPSQPAPAAASGRSPGLTTNQLILIALAVLLPMLGGAMVVIVAALLIFLRAAP